LRSNTKGYGGKTH